MKRMIKATTEDGYWYLFRHGSGPGTMPSGVHMLETKDHPTNQWKFYAKLDRALTSEECDYYDLTADVPISNSYAVKSASDGKGKITYIEDAMKEIRTLSASYKGKDPDYNYRIAEITFDDDLAGGKGAEEVADILEEEGYDIQQFQGYWIVPVDSMEDYKEFVQVYKKAKKDAIERLRHQKNAD